MYIQDKLVALFCLIWNIATQDYTFTRIPSIILHIKLPLIVLLHVGGKMRNYFPCLAAGVRTTFS